MFPTDAVSISIFVLVISSLTLMLVQFAVYLKNRVLKKQKLPFEQELQNLKENINELEIQKNALDTETKALQVLQAREHTIEVDIENFNNELKCIQAKIESVRGIEVEADQKIAKIQSKADLYSRIDDYVDHGHYDVPQYLYETSDRYAIEIKRNRDEQREFIREGDVILYDGDDDFPCEDNFFKKILSDQEKLVIRSFNIECDLLIGKVNPSNISRTIERIEAVANCLEKSFADLRYGFNLDYVELKFEECNLQYQQTLKKKEEQEEQKAIREQMREEERARKDYEKAIAEAQKEEEMYSKMLDKAKAALTEAKGVERAAAELRVQQLEEELREAMEKAARAKSMAEQTKKGHVYIISNIGSFGEGVYKIGLTRRLDPTERIKELGDASVPFSFDTHAMIYTEDAPQLENLLHKAFRKCRMNAVNLRKEFFKVSLEDIKAEVHEILGEKAEFKTTIVAEEYFQTKRLRGTEQ